MKCLLLSSHLILHGLSSFPTHRTSSCFSPLSSLWLLIIYMPLVKTFAHSASSDQMTSPCSYYHFFFPYNLLWSSILFLLQNLCLQTAPILWIHFNHCLLWLSPSTTLTFLLSEFLLGQNHIVLTFESPLTLSVSSTKETAFDELNSTMEYVRSATEGHTRHRR